MIQTIIETISSAELIPLISAELESQGIPLVPILNISIIQPPGTNFFVLDYTDMSKLLSYFGGVISLSVNSEEATVHYQTLSSAFFAQKALNKKFIQELNLTLVVSWSRLPISKSVPKVDTLINIAEYKYTCKYLIEIKNCNEFQVSRRIIGPKGRNMKRIIEECTAQVREKDAIKLRLRGLGSGYKEGPDAEESSEPLHLCVSSKYFDMFTLASRATERLILSIYGEYDAYLKKKGENPRNLRIKILN